MLRPAPPIPLTATQVWLMMTLGVERLALAFMQVLYTVIMGWYFVHPDARWSREQDLANDQKSDREISKDQRGADKKYCV